MSRPLLVVDLPWLLYRSFFALPRSIADEQGRPVNALLGAVNAILAQLDPSAGLDPRAVVACTGAENAAYRALLYPPYHAHRDPMPEELAEQWSKAPGLVESLGWTLSDAGELEADDAMFSHARAEEARGGGALLMTADRDLYAAVSPRVSVLELRSGGTRSLLGPEEVRERYGIDPEQVPDLIALRGDPSDGIPGAPGVGAKTAAAMLRAHATLDGVLDAAHVVAEGRGRREAIRPRIADALVENEELLRTFREVATLQHIDVSSPADAATDLEGGASAARALGMRRLATRLEQLASGPRPRVRG
jgi:DNA polymerase-1